MMGNTPAGVASCDGHARRMEIGVIWHESLEDSLEADAKALWAPSVPRRSIFSPLCNAALARGSGGNEQKGAIPGNDWRLFAG